jgi:CHASE1-domain containing sensor protein
MRTATVVGIILIGIGVLSLAYFASPVGFLLQETFNQQKMNLVPPILGGVALISGIALLVAVRPRVNKNKNKSER